MKGSRMTLKKTGIQYKILWGTPAKVEEDMNKLGLDAWMVEGCGVYGTTIHVIMSKDIYVEAEEVEL